MSLMWLIACFGAPTTDDARDTGMPAWRSTTSVESVTSRGGSGDTGAEGILIETYTCGLPNLPNARGAVIVPNGATVQEVSIELSCRACPWPPEVHPTQLDPDRPETWPFAGDFYRTDGFLEDAGSGPAAPGQSTNFPCTRRKDAGGATIYEALTVRVVSDQGSDCVVFTADALWWPTLEAETGCLLNKVVDAE